MRLFPLLVPPTRQDESSTSPWRPQPRCVMSFLRIVLRGISRPQSTDLSIKTYQPSSFPFSRKIRASSFRITHPLQGPRTKRPLWNANGLKKSLITMCLNKQLPALALRPLASLRRLESSDRARRHLTIPCRSHPATVTDQADRFHRHLLAPDVCSSRHLQLPHRRSPPT